MSNVFCHNALWAAMSAGDADALVRVFSLCSKQACRLDFLFLFDQAKKYEESHLGSYIALTNSSGKIFQRNCFDVWGNPIPVYAPTDTLLETPLNFTLTNRGFTGHEHYTFFKIINMNGRLYDPVIARFFSPDKYVANSTFTQDFNRYTYARNNPLMYTDPSGEFIWFAVAVGAMIGMFQSINISGHFDPGKVIAGGLIGGVAGGFGASIGSGGIGFWSAFGRGAAGGFASGMITGTFNSMMQGNSFGSAIGDGMRTGFFSGLTAGLTNGIASGLFAKAHNGNFWTGNGTTFDQIAHTPSTNTTIKEGDGMTYNNDYATTFSNDNFGYTVENLHADGSMPPKYYANGDIVYNPKHQEVWGTARHIDGKYDVYLYKAAFTSRARLYLTMQHEYLHVELWSIGISDKYHHLLTSKLSYEQAKLWNFDVIHYHNDYKTEYLKVNGFTKSLVPLLYPDPTDYFPIYQYKPWLR